MHSAKLRTLVKAYHSDSALDSTSNRVFPSLDAWMLKWQRGRYRADSKAVRRIDNNVYGKAHGIEYRAVQY